MNRLAKVSGLTEQDLKRRLADIKPNEGNRAMLEAAQEMIANPYGWLYIYGGPGNAKSEILIAICNELTIRQYGLCLYTKFTTVIDYMRQSFEEKKKRGMGQDVHLGYVDRFEQLKRVKALMIDEVDKARSTEFAEEFRFNFLDDRYRQAIAGETITVFASNRPPTELDNEGPIYDRIRDGRFKIVHNTAGSARPHMRKD